MKEKIEDRVYKISNFIEIFIATLIIIAILILTLDLILFLVNIAVNHHSADILSEFLERALTLVVGVEFVKMLCNHRAETVIEVLLFATARQMVVEHMSLQETLIGIVCIAILFAIRKFLCTKSLKVNE